MARPLTTKKRIESVEAMIAALPGDFAAKHHHAVTFLVELCAAERSEKVDQQRRYARLTIYCSPTKREMFGKQLHEALTRRPRRRKQLLERFKELREFAKGEGRAEAALFFSNAVAVLESSLSGDN